jgi:hypothetical protein
VTRHHASTLAALVACLLACGPAGKQSPPAGAGTAAAAKESPGDRCPLQSEYQPQQPPAGPAVSLPAVPTLPERAIRSDGDYTVWGASFSLRSEAHRNEVTDKELSVVGYITRTNLPEAPRCAVHRSGKADPEHCRAEIPTFWLGDGKDTPNDDAIRVMGWASNYAQLYEAMLAYDRPGDPEPYLDDFWGVALPNPLPAAGARVRVTGRYGKAFTMASSGAVEDPVMGILTAIRIDVLEPAPDLATLPGVRRAPKR